MERKLATIQVISEIKEHPNADNLLIAKILGWDVIISKNDNYKVGDKVVYFEIDSFLPICDDYEFLRKSSYKNSPILGEGFRLKPIKLRGIVSCGLILPLEVCFRDCMPLPHMEFEIGEDVTEMLNIKKWEEPERAKVGGDAIGRRPEWIEHSSEKRIQSEPELLKEFTNLPYYITTKYDGSSHFIAIDENDNFRFGSHNLELKPIEKQGSFYNFIINHNLEEKLRKIKADYKAKRIYIIGEWCGQGIQKNKLQLKKPYWYPFTANINNTRLNLKDLQNICSILNIDMVSIEEIGEDLPSIYPNIDSLLERAKQNKNNVYPGKCEGIVIRPIITTYSEVLGKDLSMKVINNEYLLKDN